MPDEGRKPLEGGAQVRLLDGHVEGVEEQAGTRKPHLLDDFGVIFYAVEIGRLIPVDRFEQQQGAALQLSGKLRVDRLKALLLLALHFEIGVQQRNRRARRVLVFHLGHRAQLVAHLDRAPVDRL